MAHSRGILDGLERKAFLPALGNPGGTAQPCLL